MISQCTNQVAVHTGSSWNSSIRSSVGMSSAGRGRMKRASAPTSRVSASIQRPSSYPSSSKRAEKVVTGQVAQLRGDRGDRAGVQAAAQQCGHGDVGAQADRHSIAKCLAEAL